MHALIDILRILAWPVTVLVLVFAFHGRIVALLKHVSSVGYGDFSVDFDRLIAPAERALGHAKNHVGATCRRRLHRLRALADRAPRAAILEAWADLSDALDDTGLARADIGAGEDASSKAFAHGSEPAREEAIDALAAVRNQACVAHDDAVNVDVAQRYVALAHQATTACFEGTQSP